MELIPPTVSIDFLKRKGLFISISGVLIAIGLISLAIHKGPKYGIDFAGGLLIQVRSEKSIAPSEIKDAIKAKGLPSPLVQQAWEFGGKGAHEYVLRMDLGEGVPEEFSKAVQGALEDHFGKNTLQVRRVEMVGPKVGKDLRSKGIKAMVFALIGLLIYISWRFDFKFACGAVLALVHDVLITLGAFSITDKDIDLPIVAAFLTIIGYSLNDTIVIYDRVRENLRKHRRMPYPELVNRSVNETLSRTILTSGTVFVVVVALYLLGGGVIHNFAFALIIGVISGTYSTIFIASPFVVLWKKYADARGPKATKIM